MVIKITGLPGNTVKVVPSQTQFDTLTVGKMQAGKKKDHSFILSLIILLYTQQNKSFVENIPCS